MEIKQIKELLANPDVRKIVEEQINAAVVAKQTELDEAIAKVKEQEKSNEKKLFILRKTILAKSDLFEQKLSNLYEAKFQEAKKSLGKEVYSHINESVKNLLSVIEKDAQSNLPVQKMQEAFSVAMRSLAPFMNVNELVETGQTKVLALESKINDLIKTNKKLTEKVLKADILDLVMSECTGYPVDKQTLILKTVQKLEPKSLTEAKEAIDATKSALKKKETEAVQESVSTQTTQVPTENLSEGKERLRLKQLARTLTENTESTVEVNKDSDATYDFAQI